MAGDWTTIPLRPAPGDPLEPEIAAARDAVAAFVAPRTKADLEREGGDARAAPGAGSTPR